MHSVLDDQLGTSGTCYVERAKFLEGHNLSEWLRSMEDMLICGTGMLRYASHGFLFRVDPAEAVVCTN